MLLSHKVSFRRSNKRSRYCACHKIQLCPKLARACGARLILTESCGSPTRADCMGQRKRHSRKRLHAPAKHTSKRPHPRRKSRYAATHLAKTCCPPDPLSEPFCYEGSNSKPTFRVGGSPKGFKPNPFLLADLGDQNHQQQRDFHHSELGHQHQQDQQQHRDSLTRWFFGLSRPTLGVFSCRYPLSNNQLLIGGLDW